MEEETGPSRTQALESDPNVRHRLLKISTGPSVLYEQLTNIISLSLPFMVLGSLNVYLIHE